MTMDTVPWVLLPLKPVSINKKMILNIPHRLICQLEWQHMLIRPWDSGMFFCVVKRASFRPTLQADVYAVNLGHKIVKKYETDLYLNWFVQCYRYSCVLTSLEGPFVEQHWQKLLLSISTRFSRCLTFLKLTDLETCTHFEESEIFQYKMVTLHS